MGLGLSVSTSGEELNLATGDLAEIDRQLNNPLTSIWSLTFQNNTSIQSGELLEGKEVTNNLFFQPFIPLQLDHTMLTLRPVFPLVTQPRYAGEDEPPRSSTSHTTGYGDTQLLTLLGPNKGEGLIWGAGATFVFPTATDDRLGKGKYQLGPSAMLFYMGDPWVGGFLLQHWESVEGDENRPDVSKTDLQYILRRSIPGAMSVGMGPTITYDWQADSDNALTLPVGLGITKTVRWGKMPLKLRAEAHYSLVKPDDIGAEWNVRLQITPVIQNPMNR